MALVRADQYSRLKCLTPLLDATVKLVVHGSDALAMVHRTPLSCGMNMPLHVLVPDDQVGLAALILSEKTYIFRFDLVQSHDHESGKNDHRRTRTCNLLVPLSDRSQTRYHCAREP